MPQKKISLFQLDIKKTCSNEQDQWPMSKNENYVLPTEGFFFFLISTYEYTFVSVGWQILSQMENCRLNEAHKIPMKIVSSS